MSAPQRLRRLMCGIPTRRDSGQRV